MYLTLTLVAVYSIITSTTIYMFGTVEATDHNNKWDFCVVRASLNINARVATSSIYFCEKFISSNSPRSST